MSGRLLTLNAGSSSIKLGLFDPPAGPRADPVERARGQVDGIGGTAHLALRVEGGPDHVRDLGAAADHGQALSAMLGPLGDIVGGEIAAVGHRIVHGGPAFAEPAILDDPTLAALDALSEFAPLHQPHNLAGVRAARAAFPEAAQIGCFDTAFHRTQPPEADAFALPRAYFDRGVRRYGFHGLSYDYIASALAAEEPELAAGRVVVAHLGNGASMAALSAGRSVASTMGLTALDGLPMGTRCGQIDPGVLLWMMQSEGMSADAISDLLYRRSGLLGLSGISNDMRRLEASGAPEADAAIAHFVHHVRRELGGLAAVLGGLDAVVFTGGIGEHSARVRAAVCSGMGWLGLSLDAEANAAHAREISAAGSAVALRVIPTNEELTIARAVARLTGR